MSAAGKAKGLIARRRATESRPRAKRRGARRLSTEQSPTRRGYCGLADASEEARVMEPARRKLPRIRRSDRGLCLCDNTRQPMSPASMDDASARERPEASSQEPVAATEGYPTNTRQPRRPAWTPCRTRLSLIRATVRLSTSRGRCLGLAREVADAHRFGRVQHDRVGKPVERAEHEHKTRSLIGGLHIFPWREHGGRLEEAEHDRRLL